MDSVQWLSGLLASMSLTSALAVVTLLAGIAYFYATSTERPYSGIPELTLDKDGSQGNRPDPRSWMTNAKAMIDKGLAEYPSCFQVLTGTGYKIVVPSRFADELRNHPDLNFNETFAKDLFINYPGFDGMKEGLEGDKFMQELVRVKLTQSLGLVTDDLVEEADEAVHDVLGDDKEWQTRLIKEDLLNLVARVSTRIFLGKKFCHNKEWLRITKEYTVHVFMSASILRGISAPLRPIMVWFNPTCKQLRKDVRDARRLVTPEIKQRIKQTEETLQAGGKSAKTADAIGWMVEINRASRGAPRDYVAAQLSLSSAAIHTTSETMSSVILRLCDSPEIMPLLREELVNVLRADGWSKTSLYKLRLMDSFIKEVQRTNGLSIIGMNRLVKRPLTLSDGTVLPAGSRIMVTDERRFSETYYSDPSKFDVARFLHMREKEGEENRHQSVTTSSDLMAFGHGQHACPGRFFAINEVKILLAFLLLKYDISSVPGPREEYRMSSEAADMISPMAKVRLRRRTEEIDMLSPRAA